MGKFNFSVDHSADKDSLKEYAEKFAQKYNAEWEWKSEYECHFSGSDKGITISGVMNIKDSVVDVSLNLPLVAMPFKSTIKETIVDGIRKVEAKQK